MKFNTFIPSSSADRLRGGLAIGLAAWMAAVPLLQAQDIVKDFELVGYEESTDPAAIAPFAAAVFFTPFVDNTTSQGAPTPELTVFRNLSPGISTGDTADDVLFSGSYLTFGGDGTELADSGAVVMDIPDIPDNSANNNIVGFVRRSGTLSSSPSTPLGGFLAGGSGSFTYPANVEVRETTLTLNLPGGETLEGPADMTVNSENVVSVGAFNPDFSDFDSLLLAPFNLLRSNEIPNLYVARIRRIDNNEPDAWFDRRVFLRLIDNQDADQDDIPDFSDLQVSYFPFFADMSLGGHWYYSSWMNTAVYAVANDWNFTTAMNWLYAPASQNKDNGVWFYSPADSVEWFWTSAEHFPYLYRFKDGAVMYYEKDDGGKPWLYNFETSSWEDPGL